MTHARTVAIVRASLLEVFADVDGWFERPLTSARSGPRRKDGRFDQVLEHISLTNHFLMLTLRSQGEGGRSCRPGATEFRRR